MTRLEVLGLVLCLMLGAGLRLLYVDHETIVFPDEGSFLELGENLRDGRGYVTDYKFHYWLPGVRHPEDNRHPALPALLAAAGKATPHGHERGVGQTIVFLLALVLIMATWLYARRLFGPLAAVIAAFLVAVQPSLAQYSAITMTEIPTALISVLVGIAVTTAGSPSPRRLAAVGALVGLAYLFRGNGAWLLVPAIAALAVGVRPARRWHFAIPVVAFALVASPWLIRNQVTFGTPNYSLAFQVYWIDAPREWTVEREVPPSFSEYRKAHSTSEILRRVRVATGLARREWWARDLWPLWLLASLGLAAQWRRQVFAWTTLVVQAAGVVWLAAVWPVARYSYPFLPLAAVVGAGGCAALFARRRSVTTAVATVALAGATVILVDANRTRLEPYDDRPYRTLVREAQAVARLPEDAIVAERYSFPWVGTEAWRHHRRTIAVGYEKPFDEAMARARSYGATYLIVPSDLAGAPHERPLVDGLPLVRRGPDWELRSLAE